jgi:hypothetical protein
MQNKEIEAVMAVVNHPNCIIDVGHYYGCSSADHESCDCGVDKLKGNATPIKKTILKALQSAQTRTETVDTEEYITAVSDLKEWASGAITMTEEDVNQCLSLVINKPSTLPIADLKFEMYDLARMEDWDCQTTHGVIDCVIGSLQGLGYLRTAPAEDVREVDVEGLKNYIGTYTYGEFATKEIPVTGIGHLSGWNDCIDYLHANGHLSPTSLKTLGNSEVTDTNVAPRLEHIEGLEEALEFFDTRKAAGEALLRLTEDKNTSHSLVALTALKAYAAKMEDK